MSVCMGVCRGEEKGVKCSAAGVSGGCPLPDEVLGLELRSSGIGVCILNAEPPRQPTYSSFTKVTAFRFQERGGGDSEVIYEGQLQGTL